MNLLADPLIIALLDTELPTLILKPNGPEFTIITYNEAYENVTYTQNREVRGISFWEAFDPSKAGTSGPQLLLNAFNKAIILKSKVVMDPLHYNIPSALPNIGELNWWDVVINPIIFDGIVTYLLINVNNITHKILYQDAIELAIIKELTLTEDLAVANVKLNSVVDQLADSNKELYSTKLELQELNQILESLILTRTKELYESEGTMQKLIDNAPIGIAILKGEAHIIETANKKIIEIWSKTPDVIGQPLEIALPELDGQPFIGILNQVRTTGISYVNNELEAYLYFNGVLQPRYYDMVYQPIQHVPGITDSIFIVGFDITEQVVARKKLEQSESLLRLAVTSANIGTWSFNPVNNELNYNPIFAKILGWEHEYLMTSEDALEQVVFEYRAQITETINTAILDGSDYDFTYPQKRFNDGKVIWLTAKGKITNADSDKHQILTGVIREITVSANN